MTIKTTMRMRCIEAGEIIALSQGEYSDYRVGQICRAKQRLDPDALQAEFAAENDKSSNPLDRIPETFASRFFLWLFTRDYLEDLSYVEMNTDYMAKLSDAWPWEEEKKS